MTQLETKYNILPAQYEKIAVIAKVAADEMMSRLDLASLQPKKIVEVGCATGYITALLKKRYPAAELIALDSVDTFLKAAQNNLSSTAYWVNANSHSLPLLSQSVDMLIANLVLPWHIDWMKLLEEWHRILRPEGLLMITTLGPDTLNEWAEKDAIYPYFLDMHHLGDGLLQAGFADPILDVDQFILSYQDPQRMLSELQMTKMLKPDCQLSAEAELQVTFEIVFGHAWGALPRLPHHTVNISLESLRRQVLTKL